MIFEMQETYMYVGIFIISLILVFFILLTLNFIARSFLNGFKRVFEEVSREFRTIQS